MLCHHSRSFPHIQLVHFSYRCQLDGSLSERANFLLGPSMSNIQSWISFRFLHEEPSRCTLSLSYAAAHLPTYSLLISLQSCLDNMQYPSPIRRLLLYLDLCVPSLALRSWPCFHRSCTVKLTCRPWATFQQVMLKDIHSSSIWGLMISPPTTPL